MARQGLKEGSQPWNLNLSNLQKQQEKERRSLQKGATGRQLQERMKKSMRRGMGYSKDARYFKGGEFDYGRAATDAFNKEQRQAKLNNPIDMSEGGGWYSTQQRQKAMDSITPVEDRIKQMQEQDAADYKAGRWFETTERVENQYGDQDPRTIKETHMSRAGMRKMDELMTQDHELFGRPLERWEAFATLRYGSPKAGAGPSAESLSAGKAAAAASGAQVKASGAEEMAEQYAAASPWVRKQELGIL